MIHAALDARPIILAIGGPNGSGKSTFYNAFLRDTRLRFLNADDIRTHLGIDSYDAAKVAGALRSALVRQRESFIFETVLSDPVGDKISFLKNAASTGYTSVLLYIGIPGPEGSDERVAMRVTQGGHDVPADKLVTRFPRTLKNLGIAIRELPLVLVFDHGELTTPFRRIAEFENGKPQFIADHLPAWLASLL